MSEPFAPVDAPYPGMTGLSRLRSLISRSSCPPRPADEFLSDWYAASGAGLPFNEWCDPATRYLATVVRTVCLVERGPYDADGANGVDSAVVQFAQARAGADYSAAEVASDIVGLFQVVEAGSVARSSAPPPQDVVRIVARALTAWATAQVESVSVGGCTDPVTGLVTGGFLRARLRELHAQCEALVIPPSATFACLVIQLTLAGDLVPVRMGARIAVGRALAGQFTSGETVAALGPERFVVVMPAYAIDNAEAAVRRALEDDLDPGVTVTILRQPFAEEADGTWRSLAGTRSGP